MILGNIAILGVAHRCFPARAGKGSCPIPPETFFSALLLALDARPGKDDPPASFRETEWAQAVVDVFLSDETTIPSTTGKISRLRDTLKSLIRLHAADSLFEAVIESIVSRSSLFPCDIVLPAAIATIETCSAEKCRRSPFMDLLTHILTMLRSSLAMRLPTLNDWSLDVKLNCYTLNSKKASEFFMDPLASSLCLKGSDVTFTGELTQELSNWSQRLGSFTVEMQCGKRARVHGALCIQKCLEGRASMPELQRLQEDKAERERLHKTLIALEAFKNGGKFVLHGSGYVSRQASSSRLRRGLSRVEEAHEDSDYMSEASIFGSGTGSEQGEFDEEDFVVSREADLDITKLGKTRS